MAGPVYSAASAAEHTGLLGNHGVHIGLALLLVATWVGVSIFRHRRKKRAGELEPAPDEHLIREFIRDHQQREEEDSAGPRGETGPSVERHDPQVSPDRDDRDSSA